MDIIFNTRGEIVGISEQPDKSELKRKGLNLVLAFEEAGLIKISDEEKAKMDVEMELLTEGRSI